MTEEEKPDQKGIVPPPSYLLFFVAVIPFFLSNPFRSTAHLPMTTAFKMLVGTVLFCSVAHFARKKGDILTMYAARFLAVIYGIGLIIGVVRLLG